MSKIESSTIEGQYEYKTTMNQNMGFTTVTVIIYENSILTSAEVELQIYGNDSPFPNKKNIIHIGFIQTGKLKGKGMCKKMLRYAMNYVSENIELKPLFSLDIKSDDADIPRAINCYDSVLKEFGYTHTTENGGNSLDSLKKGYYYWKLTEGKESLDPRPTPTIPPQSKSAYNCNCIPGKNGKYDKYDCGCSADRITLEIESRADTYQGKVNDVHNKTLMEKIDDKIKPDSLDYNKLSELKNNHLEDIKSLNNKLLGIDNRIDNTGMTLMDTSSLIDRLEKGGSIKEYNYVLTLGSHGARSAYGGGKKSRRKTRRKSRKRKSRKTRRKSRKTRKTIKTRKTRRKCR